MNNTLADWLYLLESRHPRSIDLGLERCSRVYRAMGSPRPARRLLTVAGTNGKGSVVAYASGVLQAAGYTCGSYTSPHLLSFNERVRINGIPATDGQLVDAFEVTEQARQDVSLTYFEFTTLAAFYLMNSADLDTAVLEVGLGGRLDTVNLVDPDCTVITTIGLDHQQFLGNDRESIGREKAGIMRPGIPVICSDRNPPSSLIVHARELGAGILMLGRAFDWSEQAGEIQLKTGAEHVSIPRPPMPGIHQLDNLATALTAVNILIPGFLASNNTWFDAVGRITLAGRLSTVAGDPRILIDVGHNPLAARAVAEYIKKSSRSEGKVYCVLGMLEDKDAGQVAQILDPVVDHWYCAGLKGARGQSGHALAKRLEDKLVGADVRAFGSVREALASATGVASEKELVLVFGSFETAAAAMLAVASASKDGGESG